MNFAKFAERVVILVRVESLSSTMSKYLIDQIQETPKAVFKVSVDYNRSGKTKRLHSRS